MRVSLSDRFRMGVNWEYMESKLNNMDVKNTFNILSTNDPSVRVTSGDLKRARILSNQTIRGALSFVNRNIPLWGYLERPFRTVRFFRSFLSSSPFGVSMTIGRDRSLLSVIICRNPCNGGKTWLARGLVGKLLPDYTDGVWFVDPAPPLTSPSAGDRMTRDSSPPQRKVFLTLPICGNLGVYADMDEQFRILRN